MCLHKKSQGQSDPEGSEVFLVVLIGPDVLREGECGHGESVTYEGDQDDGVFCEDQLIYGKSQETEQGDSGRISTSL